jgi:hypothetical protein
MRVLETTRRICREAHAIDRDLAAADLEGAGVGIDAHFQELARR